MKSTLDLKSGAVERTRTSTSKLTATSTLRVYQFRHDRKAWPRKVADFSDQLTRQTQRIPKLRPRIWL